MLSQSSISSKGRGTGTGWAKSFLGAARREQTGGAGREMTEFSEARAATQPDAAGAK